MQEVVHRVEVAIAPPAAAPEPEVAIEARIAAEAEEIASAIAVFRAAAEVVLLVVGAVDSVKAALGPAVPGVPQA
jgi:hypothetical protein